MNSILKQTDPTTVVYNSSQVHAKQFQGYMLGHKTSFNNLKNIKLYNINYT
jgi:hypothetical protein